VFALTKDAGRNDAAKDSEVESAWSAQMQEVFTQLFDELKSFSDESSNIDFEGAATKLIDDIIRVYAAAYIQAKAAREEEVEDWVKIIFANHVKADYKTVLSVSYNDAARADNFNEFFWVQTMSAFRENAKRRVSKLQQKLKVCTST